MLDVRGGRAKTRRNCALPQRSPQRQLPTKRRNPPRCTRSSPVHAPARTAARPSARAMAPPRSWRAHLGAWVRSAVQRLLMLAMGLLPDAVLTPLLKVRRGAPRPRTPARYPAGGLAADPRPRVRPAACGPRSRRRARCSSLWSGSRTLRRSRRTSPSRAPTRSGSRPPSSSTRAKVRGRPCATARLPPTRASHRARPGPRPTTPPPTRRQGRVEAEPRVGRVRL